MSDTEGEYMAIKRKRRRRMKKFLRPLPRRANIHRYPILKYFAATARKRDYLWSWHPRHIVRAIYLGWIIALIPIYGFQMVVAFIASLYFRANCLIAMALQWITNPFTIGPILVGQYLLGDYVFTHFFGVTPIDNSFVGIFRTSDFYAALDALKEFMSADKVFHIASATLFGGFLIAMTGAVLTHILYRLLESRNRRLEARYK